MHPASSTPLPARPLALPNLLTYGRIAAVPIVVGCMYWSGILDGGLWPRWVALAVFISAAITDEQVDIVLSALRSTITPSN